MWGFSLSLRPPPVRHVMVLTFDSVVATSFYFLGATRSIEPISYANVAGWWLTGWLSVCHSRGIVSKRLNLS